MSTIIDLSKISGGVSFNFPSDFSLGGTDGGDVLGAFGKAIGAGLATQLSPTFQNENLKNIPILGTALEGVINPLFKQLETGITETFKALQGQLATGLPFGARPQQAQRIAATTAETYRMETGRDISGAIDLQQVMDTTKALYEQEGAVGALFQKLDEAQQKQIIAKTTGALAALGGSQTGAAQNLLKTVETIAQGLTGAQDAGTQFAKKIDDLTTGTATLAEKLRQPLQKTLANTTTSLQNLSFLGYNTALKETVKLSTASRRFGLNFGEYMTKPLLSFQEAGDVAGNLGLMLKGVNFNVNEFIAAKPSERTSMVFKEIAGALQEGRLQIEQDGPAFGQQVAMFQEGLKGIVDPSNVEFLLRQARDQRGVISELVDVLETEQLGAEEFTLAGVAAITERSKPLDFVKDRAGRSIGFQATQTGQIGGTLEEMITNLNTALQTFERSGVLQAALPVATELTKFAEYSKTFGNKEGGFKGLIPLALFGNLGIDEFERSIARVSNNTNFKPILQFAKDIGENAGEQFTGYAQAVDEIITDLTSQLPSAVVNAVSKAFRDSSVIKSIGEAYDEAGDYFKEKLLGTK